MKNTGIERAVQIVGGQSELARQLGVKPQAVQQWVASGVVPPRRCKSIVDICNSELTLHDLNPLFPETEQAAA